MASINRSQSQRPTFRHIWIITGPAGSGKSMVAEDLAKEMKVPFLEGDSVSFPTVNLCFRNVDLCARAYLSSIDGILS
jgi:ATP-dependent protease Clp ATPase subunit